MRTLPTTYNYTTLYQNGVIAHYASVVIYNAAQSATYDLTNYDGVDLVQQVTLSDNIDDPGITAKISLQRDVYKKSISPQNVYSKWNQGAPLVFVGLRVLVYLASVPVDVTPVSGDFILAADQHIDQMEFSRVSVELTCSDRIMALLRNAYIDTQRTYGTSGTAIESIMQGIIDDNINTPLGYTSTNGRKITLQLPGGSPGFIMATGYPCPKQTVLDALTSLAGNIGWSLRCKWVASLGAFALCFYSPSRSVAAPMFSFPPTVLIDITQAQISKTDVRNYIYGVFTDSTNNNVRQLAVVQDAASIAKYGDPPMKMELTEAATSQINTPAQMSTLLNNALADLKDPVCEYQVTVPLFIGAEISDAYKLQADMVIFDSDQSVGLTQMSHTMGRNACNTQMTLKGALPGQYNRWFMGEARPGVSPAANTLDPSAPSVSLGANVGQIVVNYSVADQDNWQTTEVYLSGSTFSQPAQVNGKNQRPTVTLAAKGKQAHFTINALTPGSNYYVAVVVIDRDGNVGAMSAVQSIGTQTVAPYHENLAGQQDQLVRNPDLNIYTLGKNLPPDNWIFDTYSNASPAAADGWRTLFYDTIDSQTGKLSLYFPFDSRTNFAYSAYWNANLKSTYAQTYFPSQVNYQGHIFYSQPFPVPSGEVITALINMKSSVAGAFTSTGMRGLLFLVGYDINGAALSAPVGTLLIIPSTTWTSYAIPALGVPSNVRSLQLGYVSIQPATMQTAYIDRFYCNRGLSYFGKTSGAYAGTSIAGQVNANTTNVTAFNASTYNSFGYNNSTSSYYTLIPGSYQFNWFMTGNNASSTTQTIIMMLQTSTDNSTWTTALQTNQVYTTTQSAVISIAGTLNLAANTYFRFVLQNTGSTQWNCGDPSGFTMQQISRSDR